MRVYYLVGVESGKSSQYLATRIPGKGTEDIQAKSGGVADVMAKNIQVWLGVEYMEQRLETSCDIMITWTNTIILASLSVY